jgi:signal transduction histidine kinase
MSARSWSRTLLKSLPDDEMRSRLLRVTGLAVFEVLALAALLLAGEGFSVPADRLHDPVPLGAWVATGGLLGLMVLGLLAARRGSRLALQIWSHVAGGVVLYTALYHFIGSLEVGVMSVGYVVAMLNVQILLASPGYFVHANLSALAYGALLLLEHSGILALRAPIFGVAGPGWWPWFMVLANALGLNLVAAYSTRCAAVLERWYADLVQAKERLERKQAEMDATVCSIAHDIKSPVNTILLLADRVLEREACSLSPESRADLTRLTEVATHAEDMALGLLELVRVTSSDEQAGWVDMNALVARTLEDLEPRIAAKDVQVTVGTLPRVWGQREKLEHLTTNLLSNAVKYVPAHCGRVRISGALSNSHAVLTVADNGIGIAPRYHRRVFELFGRVPEAEQRVDGEAVGGTGLGLAIVKKVAEDHRGSVELESAPGVGSRFSIRLPAGRDARGS